MARIKGSIEHLDKTAVLAFFEQRAVKAESVGPLRAVIYQDKHPNLAEERDALEKETLLPKLHLDADLSVLDNGCGTGRWADVLIPVCRTYVGADVSPGLIEIARARCGHHEHARFHVCAAEHLALDALQVGVPFDRIVSFGVLIYLNDDDVIGALEAMVGCAATSCRIVLREPVGIDERLTIKEHFSTDMDQVYHAIYRTEAELAAMMRQVCFEAGFRLLDSGDMYPPALNNRTDTKQMYFVLER